MPDSVYVCASQPADWAQAQAQGRGVYVCARQAGAGGAGDICAAGALGQGGQGVYVRARQAGAGVPGDA